MVQQLTIYSTSIESYQTSAQKKWEKMENEMRDRYSEIETVQQNCRGCLNFTIENFKKTQRHDTYSNWLQKTKNRSFTI